MVLVHYSPILLFLLFVSRLFLANWCPSGLYKCRSCSVTHVGFDFPFCKYWVDWGNPVLKCVRFFFCLCRQKKSKSCARILVWDHMTSFGRWLSLLLRLPWQLEWRALVTFMSNICSISQPMSVNLVLKLSKHIDYALICNRAQRHILFVTSTTVTKLWIRTQAKYSHEQRYEKSPSTCLERTASVTATK